MPRLSSLVLLTVATLLPFSDAAPAELQRRRQGDRNDPFHINIDCSGGGERTCNADCFVILCLAGPNPVQYDARNSAQNRERSGYSSGLLRVLENTRRSWGIYIAEYILNAIGRSPEETLMANTVQGGYGEIIIPVDSAGNSLVGSRVGGQLRSVHAVAGDWYFKRFTNYGLHAPYCAALQREGGPDHSVCTKNGKDPDDPANTAFTRKYGDTPNGHPTFHMMDVDKGDRYIGTLWGAQGSTGFKREAESIEPPADDKPPQDTN